MGAQPDPHTAHFTNRGGSFPPCVLRIREKRSSTGRILPILPPRWVSPIMPSMTFAPGDALGSQNLPLRLGFGFQLPQHVLQDTAVLVIFDLLRRVDPRERLKHDFLAAGSPGLHSQFAAGLEAAGNACS